MSRFPAAARVAAFFLIAICVSPLAQACERCERATLDAVRESMPVAPLLHDSLSRNTGRRDVARLDVTAAVAAATSFVVSTMRSLSPWSRSGTVAVAELTPYSDLMDGSDTLAAALTVAEYAAAYDASDGQSKVEMPGFRHRYAWQLTYRDQGAEALTRPAQSERFPGADVTLDDSWVLGLRFELEYGWKR